MARKQCLVLFALDGACLALPLSNVERVVRAVDVVALPGAPDVVLGVIDLHGDIIPVMNVRGRLGLRARDVSSSDQLIIAAADGRALALLVDSVIGVEEYPADGITDAVSLVPGLPHVRGVVRIREELVFIHDLGTFLSLDERRRLDLAMERGS